MQEEKEETIPKLDTCKIIKEALMKIQIILSDVNLYLLHPKYDTLLFLCQTERTEFTYTSWIDHMKISGSIENTKLSDLTNYPNTVDPPNYFEEKSTQQVLVEIGSQHEKDSPLVFNLDGYETWCPKKPLIPANLSSEMTLNIGDITVKYYNEVLLYRFMDYLLFQFLDSLSPKNYVSESQALYEKNKKSYEGLDFYDVVSYSSFFSFDITIKRPIIILKPRLFYEHHFKINLGELHLKNDQKLIPGRWKRPQYQSTGFLCETYSLESKQMSILFSDNETILSPCNINIYFDFPCIETYDYNNHKPEILDLSMHIRIEPQNEIRMSMKRFHYTYLLKCLDLNINYTDNFSNNFNFRHVNTNIIQGGIQFIFKSKFPLLSFTTLLDNNKKIAEFELNNLDISFLGNNDYTKDIKITGGSLYSFLNETKEVLDRDLFISPIGDYHKVYSEENKNNPPAPDHDRNSQYYRQCPPFSINLEILKGYEKVWNIKLEKYKIYLKMYAILLLSNFFIEGFPDYENSLEKPNECNLMMIYI